MIDTLQLIGGLLLILWGANALTDGAASIAARFNISNLVIGLTIVAFGTSAPEFFISFISSLNGNTDLAIGNVVGSNLFNTLAIVGCTAMITPIPVGKGTLGKEIPLCILASAILFVCANDILFDNADANIISRTDGLVLLGFLAIFIGYTFAIARNNSNTKENEEAINKLPSWKSILFILLGLSALIGGGKLFVDGASGIARALGVAESVIGLTLVAGGTSLPELATSISAALKKNPGIAIGNVIGSNLFNIFAVLGCSATVKELPVGGITNFDFMVLITAGILMWIAGFFFGKRTITRAEGAFMVVCFIAYTTYLIASL